jgi:hypothetical protein
MKGDFSRISFDAKNHFSRVLMQQGRVTLDADPNEEASILLHYLRTLARDLIGPSGGPADDMGFRFEVDTSVAGRPALKIGAGRYYVDGILVENETDCDYAHQPDFTPPASDVVLQWLAKPTTDVWLYLDVWERHVSWIENDAIRESALGGPDTCTRARVMWQVRALARTTLIERLIAKRDAFDARLADASVMLAADERTALQAQRDKLDADLKLLTPNADGQAATDCAAPLGALDGLSDAMMTARLDPGQQVKDPCVLSPDALYRGVENHLYRVEVHRGSTPGVKPTFKWSRDNGSVATRWLATEGANGNELMVDSSRGFEANRWIELSDESSDLFGEPGLLVKLAKVEAGRLTVDLTSVPKGQSIVLTRDRIKPKVRRWDQTETDDITLDAGAVPLVETGATAHAWIDLEDGIQIQFAKGGTYRSGDYWLIPARVASGTIEWPFTLDGKGVPQWQARPPQGVEHHYAPLSWGLANGQLNDGDCLCTIEPISSCVQAATSRPIGGVTRRGRNAPGRSAASRPMGGITRRGRNAPGRSAASRPMGGITRRGRNAPARSATPNAADTAREPAARKGD